MHKTLKYKCMHCTIVTKENKSFHISANLRVGTTSKKGSHLSLIQIFEHWTSAANID